MKVMVVYESPPDEQTWRRFYDFVRNSHAQMTYMPTYDHAYQEVIAEGSDALLLMYSNDEELEAACQTWTKVWLTEGLQQILVDASLYIPDPDGGRMFDAHERSLNPPEHYCFRTKH